MRQVGPWKGEQIEVTPDWYQRRLHETIERIDWPGAAADVRRFLAPKAQETLDLWSADFFAYHVEQLGRTLLSPGSTGPRLTV